jgi:hypothetical protein
MLIAQLLCQQAGINARFGGGGGQRNGVASVCGLRYDERVCAACREVGASGGLFYVCAHGLNLRPLLGLVVNP